MARENEGEGAEMEADARAVASPRAVNIEDLRQMAKRRMPRAVFDYLDGGAEGEVTLRENCREFERRIGFRSALSEI